MLNRSQIEMVQKRFAKVLMCAEVKDYAHG